MLKLITTEEQSDFAHAQIAEHLVGFSRPILGYTFYYIVNEMSENPVAKEFKIVYYLNPDYVTEEEKENENFELTVHIPGTFTLSEPVELYINPFNLYIKQWQFPEDDGEESDPKYIVQFSNRNFGLTNPMEAVSNPLEYARFLAYLEEMKEKYILNK